jgi:hypothetical protein
VLCVCCIDTTQHGYTALMWAADKGRMECTQLLLDAAADKDLTDEVCVAFGCCVFFCLFFTVSVCAVRRIEQFVGAGQGTGCESNFSARFCFNGFRFNVESLCRYAHFILIPTSTLFSTACRYCNCSTDCACADRSHCTRLGEEEPRGSNCSSDRGSHFHASL